MTTTDKKLLRNYSIAWTAFLAIILAFEYSHKSLQRGVVIIYYRAVQRWFAGENIYHKLASDSSFNYMPTSAVLFSPFGFMPEMASFVVFRLFSGAVLAWAVWKLARQVSSSRMGSGLIYLTVFAFIGNWASVRVGQFTPLMTAFMIIAAVDLVSKRYWPAAFWLSLAVAFKPLALVYALMVIAIYRPMSWRLPIGLAAFFALPFLTQAPDYVWESYKLSIQNMADFSRYAEAEPHFRQIFRVPEFLGWDWGATTRTVIRALAALFTLALGWLCKKRWGDLQAGMVILGLSTMYVLIFSAGTEGNTYAMILPVVVIPVWAFYTDKLKREGVAMLAVVVLILISYELTGGHDHQLKPLLSLVFYFQIAWLVLTNKQPDTLMGKT